MDKQKSNHDSDFKPEGKIDFSEIKKEEFLFGKKTKVVLILLAVVICSLLFFKGKSNKAESPNNKAGFYTVSLKNLKISVTESGDIKSTNNVNIRSEVQGNTAIITLVEEGTYITPEDVNEGKIIVELDSSEIEQKLLQQEINFYNSEADLIEATEGLDLQKKQMESDVTIGKMQVRSAFMNIQKYLGKTLTEELISDANETGYDPNSVLLLIDDPRLSGEASGKLKECEDSIILSEAKFVRANDKLQWSEKLCEKKYIAETELQGDELEVQSLKIQKEKAVLSRKIFKSYEFVQEVESLLSTYYQSKQELEQVEVSGISALAQAEARLESSKATLKLDKKNLFILLVNHSLDGHSNYIIERFDDNFNFCRHPDFKETIGIFDCYTCSI